jgi:hypothetical protein
VERADELGDGGHEKHREGLADAARRCSGDAVAAVFRGVLKKRQLLRQLVVSCGCAKVSTWRGTESALRYI